LVNGQDTIRTQLFNGKDLTGWKHTGPGEFIIEDGMLKTKGGMGLLWYTKQKFSNTILKIVYKTVDSSNSGVFIRIPEPPEDEWAAVHNGYEVQIDERGDEYYCTGVLYSFTKAKARPGKINEWNTMEIILDDDNTIVKVNGVEVTNYKDGDEVPPKNNSWEPDRGKRPAEGYIGLQNHSDIDTVYFKEVSVKRISKK
jgi:hypothetical protein